MGDGVAQLLLVDEAPPHVAQILVARAGIGGGVMDIEGIMYFPKQPLKITGNGDIGTGVAQFAIMADTISIEGNGQLNIKIGQNYQSSGLPALPEAGETISLIE